MEVKTNVLDPGVRLTAFRRLEKEREVEVQWQLFCWSSSGRWWWWSAATVRGEEEERVERKESVRLLVEIVVSPALMEKEGKKGVKRAAGMRWNTENNFPAGCRRWTERKRRDGATARVR
ncbi:hypothetical protein HAX54_000737 [Datura stramonium]|uniref:Uncharacterized protein n=1 Tax=Datura stramonium TaxID=4076 RepID=A0ABS8WQ95_DATST|nr:hypothetical protein [Datura stramonium]